MEAVEVETLRLTAMLLSLEHWTPQYYKAPDQHEQLIKLTAKLQLLLVKFFKNMSKQANHFINWDHYNYQVNFDYNVDVIVNDGQIDNSANTFIQVNYQTINELIVTGAQSGQAIYDIPLQISKTDKRFQRAALQKVAEMVGKKAIYNADGSLKEVIDNPDPKYNIMNTVRNDIAASIENSLAMNLSQDEATNAIEDIIADPSRSALIANTESVNAYNIGVMNYGDETNAVGKEWESSNSVDMCAENADAGPIPIFDDFPSGASEPTAHPNCMCAVRLIYQEEWDREGYGDR